MSESDPASHRPDPSDAVRRALAALPADAGRLVARFAHRVRDEAGLLDLMQKASAEAVGMIADVTWAGVTAQFDGLPFTASHTDARVLMVDEGQYHEGDGPCLRAMRTGRAVWMSVDDVRAVWAELAVVADRIGVRAFYAEPVHVRDTSVGALNLYSDRDGGLRRPDRRVLTVLVHYLEQGLTDYSALQPGEDLAVLVQEVARWRLVVGQATGILMGLRGIDVDSARRLLDRLADEQGVSLVVVAQDLVDQRSPPPIGPRG